MERSNQRVTKESVWKVADELFAKGVIVTQEKVRKEIGYGSYSTIGKYLKEWKDREDNDVSAKNYPMPDSIKKLIGDGEISQLFWNTFCQKYELISNDEKVVELEKEIESLQERLEILNQNAARLDEVRRLYNELLNKSEEKQAKIDSLESDMKEMLNGMSAS
ncbi:MULTISPECIES: DNA-binding protein [Calothrix]|uniref:DNA-binding protein n=2 Tax=Calothrix TaxID=1186 RepID=A0ABR8AME4_9CYAN|nr:MULTISPECIES: DNA-binding protein [Calothrix]MBD2200410.1 DNA-binding protein [Calothrix parietina FACHB-288]MBD2229393.1 DNA-binding protein [Calothrix anomala FACHB-343]